MKVAVLTLWQSSDNYGQLLQCWALQQVLIQLGHDPYLIRLDVNAMQKKKKTFFERLVTICNPKSSLKVLKRRINARAIASIVKENELRNQKRNFSVFKAENIKISQTIYSSLSELQCSPPEADAYIVGSDQVWAFLLDKTENQAFYLNFGKKNIKRISYAASFSVPSYPVNLTSILRENLDRFDAISVRESTGKKICENIGKRADLVLDPTLLLDKSHYLRFCTKQDSKKNGFIYLYYLNVSTPQEISLNCLMSFAKRNNLAVKATNASGYIPGREFLGITDYEYSNIEEWLANIKDASFVVTTSFHGVVFSLIMHTKVIFIPLKGTFARGNNRVFDLFEQLNLMDFIYRDDFDFSIYIEKKINWELIEKKLSFFRQKSIDYLKNALS